MLPMKWASSHILATQCGSITFPISFHNHIFHHRLCHFIESEKWKPSWAAGSPPVLLLSMVILCVVGFVRLDAPFQAPTEAYAAGSIFERVHRRLQHDGCLAALAFGIVILTSIQQRGISERKQLTRYTVKAGSHRWVIVFLSLYLLRCNGSTHGAGWVIRKRNGYPYCRIHPFTWNWREGPSWHHFHFSMFSPPSSDRRLLADSISRTFFQLNYKTVILIVTIVGFILSNMGLNQILKVSVPFLVMGLSVNDRPDCPDILQPSFQKPEERFIAVQ